MYFHFPPTVFVKVYRVGCYMHVQGDLISHKHTSVQQKNKAAMGEDWGQETARMSWNTYMHASTQKHM
jgi:hypothetical protein